MNYQFPSITDFNLNNLVTELKALFPSSYSYINVIDGVLDIYFSTSLDNAEQATLSDWLENHHELDDPSPFSIISLLPPNSYADPIEVPIDVNFNTGLIIGLSSYTLDYIGLRVGQVYEQTVDPFTGNALATPKKIIFERYLYDWDAPTGLPTARRKVIYYYREDETKVQGKILYKDFKNSTDREQIKRVRRETIITWLIARSKELGLNNVLSDYFDFYSDLQVKYVNYGDPELIDTIQADAVNSAWLDLPTGTVMGTIREAVTGSLAGALLPTPDSEVTTYLNSIGF